jgi:hypothetical protein
LDGNVAPPIITARGRGDKKVALAGGGDETCSGHDDLEKTRFVAEKIILSDTAMYKGIDNNKCPSTRCNDCRLRSSVFQREWRPTSDAWPSSGRPHSYPAAEDTMQKQNFQKENENTDVALCRCYQRFVNKGHF